MQCLYVSYLTPRAPGGRPGPGRAAGNPPPPQWPATALMNRSLARSLSCHLMGICSLFCLAALCFYAPPAKSQNLDKPLQSIDEEITAFAYAPDGRIVYSVYRRFKTKLYDLEHVDICLQEANGKRRRLLDGQKFNPGNRPFSYIA